LSTDWLFELERAAVADFSDRGSSESGIES